MKARTLPLSAWLADIEGKPRVCRTQLTQAITAAGQMDMPYERALAVLRPTLIERAAPTASRGAIEADSYQFAHGVFTHMGARCRLRQIKQCTSA